MEILILEGIATSGKSTISDLLARSFPADKKVIVAGEDLTHVPIMEVRSELHIDFFKDLIEKLIAQNPDVLILDRLYMTQAFRAKCGLSEYRELEEWLLRFNPTTIFLKIEEKAIAQRIQKATEHRDPGWAEYVKTHGDGEKYAEYYIDQQRSQLELLRESLLPCKIINNTSNDYEAVVGKIIN